MTSTDDIPAIPSDPDGTTRRVLVATDQGLHDLGGRTELAGRTVTAATGDGDDVWVLVDGRELHRLGAHGAELVASLDAGWGTCVHAHAGSVFVGGEEARLWRARGAALDTVRSFATAPTSTAWHTPWGGPPAVLSMASAGDDLFVGVHVGGILRSSDGGVTWSATIDLHDDVHQVVTSPDGTVWAATGRRGLAASTDRGRSWTYHSTGLHASYLLTVAPTDAGVLVGASSGHAGRDGAVYLLPRDPSAGGRFERIDDGLPTHLAGAVGPRRLAGLGDTAALATPDGSIHVSEDGGRRWRSVDRFGEVNEVVVTALPDRRSASPT